MIVLSLLTGAPLLVLAGPAAARYALFASTATAYLSAATAVYAASRTTGRTRGGWLLLAVGSGGWALGNTYWTWNELIVHASVLFPSWADLGFLTFPGAGAAGLWLLAGRSSLGSRLNSVLDGLIFTGSLLVISWIMTLRAIYQLGGDTWLSFVVSMAYPCGDLVLGTMVFLLATRTRRGSRGAIALVIVGLLGMTEADTLFAVATADGTYRSGALSDAGWIIGFAALAFAGWHSGRRGLTLDQERAQGRWQLLLPYYPFALALLISAAEIGRGLDLDLLPILTLLTVFALIMIRQLITLLNNSSLNDQLRHQAFHDSLTGLANRALFTDRLEHALALRGRGVHELVVMYLDLDDFKLVNDSLGHDAGDTLLQGVAERLKGCFQAYDTIARLGGDEFAVIVEGSVSPGIEAQKILDSLRHPFTARSGPLRANVSIGVATTGVLAPSAELTPEDLMKQVDLALYAAKSLGKSNYAVFEPMMWHNFDEEMSLRKELAKALEIGGLSVLHQPIHELATGRVVGVEALARWSDGTLGEVPPATFIPVAERAQLITPIGDFVLNRACQEFSRWNDGADLYLSVNVSPLQLLDPAFSQSALATLSRHGLRADQLVLEVTETALAEESEIAPVLSLLRDRGFRIAIDDFGTGYSSLRYLHHFPADIIKIDRSYVEFIEADDEAANLLGALLQMVSALGLKCIAEGIETQGQADRLMKLGCRYSQGFLFSRPVQLHKLARPSTRPATRAPHPPLPTQPGPPALPTPRLTS